MQGINSNSQLARNSHPRCSVACKLIKILNPQRDSINVSNNNSNNNNENNNNCSMDICEWLKKSRQQKCFSKIPFYTLKTPKKRITKQLIEDFTFQKLGKLYGGETRNINLNLIIFCLLGNQRHSVNRSKFHILYSKS